MLFKHVVYNCQIRKNTTKKNEMKERYLKKKGKMGCFEDMRYLTTLGKMFLV